MEALSDTTRVKFPKLRPTSNAMASLTCPHGWCHALVWTPSSLAEASICLEPVQSARQIDAVVLDGLGRWWPVSERTVGSDGVVVVTPLLDQHLGLLEAVEDLAFEQLVAQRAAPAPAQPLKLSLPSIALLLGGTRQATKS